jgi:hypothetical protein
MKKIIQLIIVFLACLLLPAAADGSKNKNVFKLTKNNVLNESRKANRVVNKIILHIENNLYSETKENIIQENSCYETALERAPLEVASDFAFTMESLAVKRLRDIAIYTQLFSKASSTRLNKIINSEKFYLFSPWKKRQTRIVNTISKKAPFSACAALERWQNEGYQGITDITDDLYGDGAIYSLVNRVETIKFHAAFFILDISVPWKKGEPVPSELSILIKSAYDRVLLKAFPSWWR